MSDSTKIKTKILQRIDTQSNWENHNPTLSVGEIVFVQTDIGTLMKVGNGQSYDNTPFYPNVKIDNNMVSSFNLLHISLDEYEKLVENNQIDENTAYLVSSDYTDVFGEQIKNISNGTDENDAVNYGQLTSNIKTVSDLVGDINIPVHYGTCATAAGTAQKIVECSTLTELKAGVTIFVKFTYTNTSTTPSLNVNGTGAKRAYRYGTTNPVSYTWYANQIVSFTYDGTYWLLNRPGPATASYEGIVKLLTTGVTGVGATGAATNSSIYNTLTAQIYPTEFTTTKQYHQNDVVLYSGQLYRCLSDYMGTWSTSCFTRLTIGNTFNLVNESVRNLSREVSSTNGTVDAISSTVDLRLADFSAVVSSSYQTKDSYLTSESDPVFREVSSSFLTEHQSLSNYYTKSYIDGEVSALETKISLKCQISVDGVLSDIEIVNIAISDYEELVQKEETKPNCLYITYSPVTNMYGERVINIAEAVDDQDAVPLSQIRRDYISKSALSSAIATLDSSSTTAQLIAALKGLI